MHTWCNLTEIHCSFCLTFFLSLKMFLCGTNLSFPICFSFSALYYRRVLVVKEVKRSNQNSSARLSDASLFSGTTFTSSSSYSGTVWKHSSSSCHLLLIPVVWRLLALVFRQDPCLQTLLPHIYLFVRLFIHLLSCPHPISFKISLIGSFVNPVKSCATSGHSFLKQEFISGLMSFTAFSVVTMASSMV